MTTINSINITNNFLNIKYKSNDPPEPTKSLIGAWSEIIKCGDNSFDLISLASALPQNYEVNSYDAFFSGNIEESYQNIPQNNKKYFLSIGGSNAIISGWTSFLNILNDDINFENFVKVCNCRHIIGIDWDIENFDESLTQKLKNISTKLKQNGFKIMFTILLGKPEWFKDLFSSNDDSHYDYVSLMLYNGGMYQADSTGIGCDWNEWAELFLSNGKSGCSNPLHESKEKYIESSNLENINSTKIILGLRADDNDNTKPATVNTYIQAENLVNKYNSSGVLLWVVQSDKNYKYINDILSYKNRTTITTCTVNWSSCNSTTKPCLKKKTCVASYCFKIKQKVPNNSWDEQCSKCTEESNIHKWPCDETGFCEEVQTYNPNNC